jgi:aryl-alcohol dehydrogenase-like predicted oxidoreductase
MEKRKLGRTGIEVSPIALGTWGLAQKSYGPVDASRFEDTVKAAWDAGVTTFDVAPLWGDGEAEKRTALALGEHLNDAILVGRAGHVKIEGRILAQFDTYIVVQEVEGPLRRLGRSHLDVLLLHQPPAKVLGSHLFDKSITQLKQEGKLRAWGVSVGSVADAELALDRGAEVISFTHNMLAPDDFLDLAERIAKDGAGMLARSPLMHGMLAGTWANDTTFPETDHRSRRWAEPAFHTRLAQVEKLRFLVDDASAKTESAPMPEGKPAPAPIPDLATAALRYVLATPIVSAALVGARSAEQIQHAVRAIPEPGVPLFAQAQLEKLAEMEL